MTDNNEMHEILVDLKGGIDRIEGKIDSHTTWMEKHTREHAAIAAGFANTGRRNGVLSRAGAIVGAAYAALIGLFNMPRGGH